MGKLTHTGKFRLTIGALDLLSQYAKYKVCSPACCQTLPSFAHHDCRCSCRVRTPIVSHGPMMNLYAKSPDYP
jgi:hypothetical protein